MAEIGVDGAGEIALRNLVRRIRVHWQQVDALIVNRVGRKHLATGKTSVAVDSEVQHGGGNIGTRRRVVGHLHGDLISALTVDLGSAHNSCVGVQAHSFGKAVPGRRHHGPSVRWRTAGRRQSRAVALILCGHGHARRGDLQLRHCGGAQDEESRDSHGYGAVSHERPLHAVRNRSFAMQFTHARGQSGRRDAAVYELPHRGPQEYGWPPMNAAERR